MDHKHTLDVATHVDDDVSKANSIFQRALYEPELLDDDSFKPVSTFTSPVIIEMGTEDSELLESEVNKEINETVKADEDWTELEGTHSIDTSVVAGFMFQIDAGKGCWITMTANGNRPIQILIDDEQDFAMYLVVVLRHEKWITCGNFYLRFVRRVPISAKECTTCMDEPVAGTYARHVATPSAPRKESTEMLKSATADSTDIEKHANQRIADWVASTINEVPPQILPRVALTKDDDKVPPPRRPENSQHGDITDEEDHGTIGAAASRETDEGSSRETDEGSVSESVSLLQDGDTIDEEDHGAIGAATSRERRGSIAFQKNE